MWIDDRPSVPCGLCGTLTPMTGTKRCDRCWELESRIYSDPALAQKILDDMKQQGQATPPNTPVDMITLSEFMAEQEALHPGIHDKVQAAADELRASLAQQPAEPSKTVNVVGMPEFDGLLDHIYEYGTAAEGVIEKANAFARAVIARYAPQQPAAPSAGQVTGITATELGYALKRATPAQVIEYLEDDVNMRVALSIHFEEQHDQQPAAVDEAMVERATTAYLQSRGTYEGEVPVDRNDMRAALIAALATQHQEPTT